ncbi:MAG: HAD family phosphatase [Polyangiales bacterium]
MTHIRAVFFDMDGVLVDACDWHYDAFNEALAQHGYTIERGDHLARFDGLSTSQKLKILTDERGLSPSLHRVIHETKQEITMRLIRERAHPDPAHVSMLTRLRGRGYRTAVCSNAVRASVALMMERIGLAPLLDLMLSNEDVARGKPDPEIYLTAAARFGLQPAECLTVEDNQNGLAAARAAGIHYLPVRNPDDVRYEAVVEAIERAEMGAAGDVSARQG